MTCIHTSRSRRRVVKKVPDLLEQFVDKAAELLNDRSQAVVLCGATLMLHVSAGQQRQPNMVVVVLGVVVLAVLVAGAHGILAV